MPLIDINAQQTDGLSPAAMAVLRINLGEAYSSLVAGEAGNAEARRALAGATGASLVASALRSGEDAQGLLAGLWLWHDWLDESHAISQRLETPTGSFWHAIMHRREGDFSNSKYWYARCPEHPVLATLAANTGVIVNPLPADKRLLRLTARGWNANAWVDLVESVHGNPADPLFAAAVSLQQLEWRLLFDHCARGAAGG